MNDIKNTYWDVGLKNFIQFVKQEGHPFVPMRKKGMHGSMKNDSLKDAAFEYGLDKDGNPFKLGVWVVYARRVMNEHIKNPTLLSAKRKRDLARCGFMQKTDIRELLIGDIKDNAYKIDEFMQQVSVIISKKLAGSNHELSLERYFYKEAKDEAQDYNEDIEPSHEYKFPEDNNENLSRKLKDYHDEIILLETTQKRIKKLKSEIREVLSNPERYYIED